MRTGILRNGHAHGAAARSAAAYAHRATGCLLNSSLRQHIFEIFGANGVWHVVGNQVALFL